MTSRLIWLAVVLAVVLSTEARSIDQAGGPTLLVIPSRSSVIQFATDIAHIRSLRVVAYDKTQSGQLIWFIWDENREGWEPIGFDEIQTGNAMAHSPSTIFLISQPGQSPAGITAGYSNTHNIESLNIKDIVNALHEELSFRPSEWKWLARRYGLQLKDRNAERRRYGRYGRPGGKPLDSGMDSVAPMPEVAPFPEPESINPDREASISGVESIVESQESSIERGTVVTEPPGREKGVPLPEEGASETLGKGQEEAIASKEPEREVPKGDIPLIEK